LFAECEQTFALGKGVPAMALLWMDGFDYAVASVGEDRVFQRYDTSTYDTSTIITTSRTHYSDAALDMATMNIGKDITMTGDTLVIGFSLNIHTGVTFDSTPDNNNDALVQFYDGATGQFAITVDGSDNLVIRGGAYNGSIIETSSVPLVKDEVFHYYEVKVKFHATTGTVEIRKDGSTIYSTTNVDTDSAVTGKATRFYIGTVHNSSGVGSTLDNLYVLDGSGSFNNDFLGFTKVIYRQPTADTAQKDFTPDSGTVHYDRVDELTYDTTTWLESTTTNHADLFGMEDLDNNTLTVHGVQGFLEAISADAGTRSVRQLLKSGTTTSSGSTHSLSASYDSYLNLWEVDPDTSTQWVGTDVDGLEFGFEVVL
jgi:hypothetical protein